MFQSIELIDKPVFDKVFQGKMYEASECTFTNLYLWRKAFNTCWTIVDGFLCVKAYRDGRAFVLPPFGDGTDEQLVQALHTLMRYFKEHDLPFIIKGTFIELKQRIEKLLPEVFSPRYDRDNFDYVYLSRDLIELEGRSYHQKKNHLNHFSRAYPEYRYEPITPDLIGDCAAFTENWFTQRGGASDYFLQREQAAILDALTHFEELGLTGGAILVNGKVEAFSVGELVNPDMAMIHIEKANPDMRGIYQAINHDFCKHSWSDITFINREEDMGVPGLRKAKQSYNPVRMVEKYELVLKV